MPLSEELKARITAEFPKYPERRAVLLTALHFIQEECGGWVSPDLVPELAELLGILPIDVEEVVSFYPMYHSDPVGRFHVQVCTNIACCIRGARGVVRKLEDAFDLLPGDVTPDGQFSIGEVECLGSCGTAPVVMVNNERFVENVLPEDVPALVEKLRARAADGANGTGGGR
ncbi:MAG: NADH-quinone oxidoreductase subunit NuoE [Alphaproteobacteria bacterium]